MSEAKKMKKHNKTKYSIYRANEEDYTYLQNNYNFEDHSMTLLIGDQQILRRMIVGTSHEAFATPKEIKQFWTP